MGKPIALSDAAHKRLTKHKHPKANEARGKASVWKPTTARGRRLAALLEAGKAERGPDLTDAEFERELRERRGRQF